MRRSKLALIAIALSSSSGMALAQGTTPNAPSQTPAVATDEIIVTAQKREQRLQDVPISITAISGDQLKRQGVNNPEDLAKVVSGFSYQSGPSGIPIFTIRGIGLYDTSAGISPTVSVYVDQVPLPFLIMTPGASLDVERVEVLKGPQGTLFGENATGGAINYIAAKPTTVPHEGFDLSYGRFNSVLAQGFVSGPVTNTLSVRVSAEREYREPWQISQSRPGDSLGKRDFSVGRVLLDWKPGDRLSFELNANGWRDRSDTTAAQFVAFRATLPPPLGYPESAAALANRQPAPDNARIADWDAGTSFQKNDWLYQFSLRGDWKASDQIKLTSITSYVSFKAHEPTDTDGTNFDVFQRTIDARVKTFYQEVRLAGDFKIAKLTAGLNYQNDSTDELDPTTYEGSNSGVGPFRYQNFVNVTDQKAQTYAAFASVDVPITSTLTAQAGVRYTKQNRDFQGCLRDAGDGKLAAAIALVPVIVAGLPYAPGPAGGCVTLNSSFNRVNIVNETLNQENTSWRAGLDWKPNGATLVYGNVTRGFKAGAFVPLPAVFAAQLTPVTQEQITAYEIGAKLSALDHRVEFDAAAFYYDYLNKQIVGTGVFPPFGALPQLQNIPKSNVKGGEIDITIHPTKHWTLRGGATYIKSEVSQSYVTPDPLGTATDVKGEAFPDTPKWQVVGGTEYQIPLDTLKAFVGANIAYRSATNAAFGLNPLFNIKPYALVDLRAGIGAADGKWTVEIWGKNVFNKFYYTSIDYAVDTIARTPALPATYGFTLRSRF